MSVSETEANISDHLDALALGLTCPICLDLFSEPVSIPCGHVYCSDCLRTMGEGLDQHSCPECRANYKTDEVVKSFNMCSIIETYKAAAVKVNSTATSDVSANGIATEESDTTCHQDVATSGESLGVGLECKGEDACESGAITKVSPPREKEKFRLASEITELSLRLEMARGVLRGEEERESGLSAAHGQLREKAFKLLAQIQDASRAYGAQVMQLMEEELGPGEARAGRRVGRASEQTEQLSRALGRAESLLAQEGGLEFDAELLSLQPRIEELLSQPVPEEEDDHVQPKASCPQACSKLESLNAELRKGVGELQRCLRNTLNPSEVTFDPKTAHPNLVLSEDLKTVTFSASKQPYPSSSQRFTSFLQVLSTQSFCEGDHCWEVELEGSPWIVGVCYGGELARSGLASALESSRSAWCLMWFDNLLTAFERSHSVPLKKTTSSRKLEMRLSFKTHRLSFYNISAISGRTHVYTFKAVLTEPVHVAYRMISGQPNARVTVYS